MDSFAMFIQVEEFEDQYISPEEMAEIMEEAEDGR